MCIKQKQKFRGVQDNYYKDSLINNIYYDIHNNFGFNVAQKDIPSMLNKMLSSKGFIRDAKDYNKRAQILFNSGQTTNTKVANEYLKSFKKRFKKEYNLSRDWKPLEFQGKKKDVSR